MNSLFLKLALVLKRYWLNLCTIFLKCLKNISRNIILLIKYNWLLNHLLYLWILTVLDVYIILNKRLFIILVKNLCSIRTLFTCRQNIIIEIIVLECILFWYCHSIHYVVNKIFAYLYYIILFWMHNIITVYSLEIFIRNEVKIHCY